MRPRTWTLLATPTALVLLLLLPSCAILRGKGREPEARTTDSGLVVVDLGVPPEGPRARLGDVVTLDYEMRLDDGTVIDSSLDRGRPVTFELGQGRVPPGFEEGVVGMRKLGRRKMRLHPGLAYGAAGLPPRVPPDADLVIHVELLEIAPRDGEGDESESNAKD